ncbi:retrotransposon protein, putative, ty1-copia subclass [Tanacetum coccineum]
MEFEVEDRVMLKVSPWKGVVRFGKRGKLNPRYVRPFRVLAKVGKVAYNLELPQELSRVHHTFHVSNLKKCYSDEPLVVPLEGIHVDDKLQFVEEPVEIMEREIKLLKRNRIPLVKVRWNSRRGPEFTWEHLGVLQILIAVAAFYDYEIWQMDVKTAFLNGYLSEEVYMEQPEGFVNPKHPKRKFGFTKNPDEPCVYLKASGSNVTFLILYVDGILIMGNNIPILQGVKSYLGRCFAMKDLGEAAYILGIKTYRDRSQRLIGLCQSACIEKILKRYHMENSKRGSIPMQEKLRLSKSQGASTPAELKRMQNVPYASAVGSIMYAVRCTRPDVAFAQNITSRFQQNPGDLHWTTVKNILKVSCYTDAGYLTDADDLKSQTGYVFVLNGGAVDWKSAKQSIFATSSAEAEYIAAFDASKEAEIINNHNKLPQ